MAKRKIGFVDYIKAGYPLLWLHTSEEERAITTLSKAAPSFPAYEWDMVSGWRDITSNQVKSDLTDPIIMLQTIVSLSTKCIIFVKDFHHFLQTTEIYRTVKNMIPQLKLSGKHLVFVSPIINIPVELDKDISLVEFSLPTVSELTDIAKQIVTDNELEIDVTEKYGDMCRGLSYNEAENAFALSLVTSNGDKKKPTKFDAEVIQDEKLQAIRKSGLLELMPVVEESQLGGLLNLRKYIHNRKSGFAGDNIAAPKGILVVGPPGSGKTLAAKVVAYILGFPLVRLDFGTLKNSLQGKSEENLRRALTTVDGIGRVCILMDEIEKVLGGVLSSARTDGGTTATMFSYLLTWMQESAVAKYMVGTCNDMGDLLQISQGALLRRFDDIWFVDIPGVEERREILKIMNKRYNTEIPEKTVDALDGWTGAEIEKLVKSSKYDGLEESVRGIHPVYEQNKVMIDKAREWAKANCRMANVVEIEKSAVGGRRIGL